jgi:GAF domain-containing protein
MTAPPDDTTADLHAVVSALRAERDAALSEKAALADALATRNNEFGERTEQQAATIDVLKAMSASPGDARPVFELIVERARAFCEADYARLVLLEGDMLQLQAHTGVKDAAVARDYEAQFPRPVGSTTLFGRAILAREAVQTADLWADAAHHVASAGGAATGARSIIAVPLLRMGMPIGAIALGRRRPGEFSATQIELLRTFAEEAVIAITSAETYRALQTRTSDLQEALEYQTATSDVLKVISRSTFDLQPMLDTVSETAARLCNAEQAAIYRREGDLVRLVANCGFPPEYEAVAREAGAFPFDRSPQNVGPRAIREGRPVHIHDVAAVPDYGEVSINLGRQRTSLGVPLLREGEVIGTIVLARQRVQPFTDRQIELVRTFADQAVIAIENTRLITEQREALDQQTATAEVLQVINASPGDLSPVFDAMLEKAIRLCEAEFGTLRTWDGQRFHLGAARGDQRLIEWTQRHGPFTPDDDAPL